MVLRITLYLILIIFYLPVTFAQKQAEKPMIEAIKSRNNILYAGIDNLIRINDTIAKHEECIVKTKDSYIFRSDTSKICYTVIPDRIGKIPFEIYYAQGKDTLLIFSESLKCMYLPGPLLTINGNVIKNRVVDSKILNQAHKIGLFITNDIIDIDEWYDVVGFKFGIRFDGAYNFHHNMGNTCSRETKTIMSNLYPGSEVMFRVSVKSRTDVHIRSQSYKFLVY